MYRFSVVLIACACSCFSASAQIESPEGLEEIVVNADYRQSKISEISSSVTVLDAE